LSNMAMVAMNTHRIPVRYHLKRLENKIWACS
jgi:hypothetical protein